ncbi:AraC family transcriptional regulator [Spiractinospora alimapuensis]|uniref:AraC family transcriptional regulator n=1 Tax=Spiractinospora alimapuensis TaxID=2820884 RepID=UPI001F3FCB96|nr:AraC family transcriptional regulator [Spiractinospora alimapuensis]
MDQREWVRYRRSADVSLEAMHAHLERHSYHVHSHDAYSFGLTEFGAQDFKCRGESRRSSAGMVMAFNPDDPHDGHAADDSGFTYRIVHIAPSVVADVLDQSTGDSSLPLFTTPVIQDRGLFTALHRLHRRLMGGHDQGLSGDEALLGAIHSMARTASHAPRAARPVPDAARLAARATSLIRDRWNEPITPADLSGTLGRSRFAIYRAFQLAHGMAPSDYQRQLRLRAARRQLVEGTPIATVALSCGFADQSHLTRWFTRYYGVPPGLFVTATDGRPVRA